ncbi:MAG: hypothetical protein BWY99_00389 [Synergistetes bacterium ADurb.BinA166]|nr:MAG: hypothetical protein BWY99_00389 [Synergistetes bacterium ADurb.BinA166]
MNHGFVESPPEKPLMASREQHSSDESRYICHELGPNEGWVVVFDGTRVSGIRTREEARDLIRAFKKDPESVPVYVVQES